MAGVDHLRTRADPFSDPHRPPPPPPKPPRMHADLLEPVRDTVTTKDPPRTRVGRSQTALSPASPSRTTARRSQSEESAQPDKPRSQGKPRGKKSSQHADVIDRLDFTGVGLFHHDGPFDACAPSRNKQRNNAPLYAWGNVPDPSQYGDSPYAASHAYNVFSDDYPEPPKKKVDAIAEAWGIHEPEPYEEFFAGGGSTRPDGDTPASSIYNGRDSHSANSRSGLPKRPKEDHRDIQQQQRPRVATRRSLVPPPQPIFVPDPLESHDPPSSYSPPPSSGSGAFPKRQKSIMQRIRKMRDSPNVPVGPEYYNEQPPSPNSPLENSQPTSSVQQQPYYSRPTHKPQNSFLGRFAGGKAQPSGADRSEPFLLIDPLPSSNKDLPPPPVIGPSTSGDSTQAAAPEFGSPGINRKTSIMKKVGRVVRGTR